jgi:hypothetical protein
MIEMYLGAVANASKHKITDADIPMVHFCGYAMFLKMTASA